MINGLLDTEKLSRFEPPSMLIAIPLLASTLVKACAGKLRALVGIEDVRLAVTSHSSSVGPPQADQSMKLRKKLIWESRCPLRG